MVCNITFLWIRGDGKERELIFTVDFDLVPALEGDVHYHRRGRGDGGQKICQGAEQAEVTP